MYYSKRCNELNNYLYQVGWIMARKISKRTNGSLIEAGAKVDCTGLYIRVSTEKQADEGFSLDMQESRLRAYCEAQQWNVCPNHVYVDAGISGKSTDREQFQAMMQAARAGDIKRIVAIKLDRLARNTKDFLQLVETLQGFGCDLVLIKESFDTSTPQGKFALTMFAAIAELEASTITERVMAGKAQKASEGGYNGSQCPFGYVYADNAFAVNETQAGTVKEVFKLFIAGSGMSAIAENLNQKNIGTVRGGSWRSNTIRYILTNGFYAGLSQWGETEVEGNQPAIITRKVYEQAHKRLQTIKPGRSANY